MRAQLMFFGFRGFNISTRFRCGSSSDGTVRVRLDVAALGFAKLNRKT